MRHFATKLYISKFTSTKNRGKTTHTKKGKRLSFTEHRLKKSKLYTSKQGYTREKRIFSRQTPQQNCGKIWFTNWYNRKDKSHIYKFRLARFSVLHLHINTKEEHKTKLHALKFSISHHLADFDFEIWCMSPLFVFVNSPREKARFTANQSKIAPTSPPPSPRT